MWYNLVHQNERRDDPSRSRITQVKRLIGLREGKRRAPVDWSENSDVVGEGITFAVFDDDTLTSNWRERQGHIGRGTGRLIQHE